MAKEGEREREKEGKDKRGTRERERERERNGRMIDGRQRQTRDGWRRYRIIFVDSCGKLAKWWIDLQSGGWVGRSVMCEIFERHAKRDLALDRACTTLRTHVAPTIYDLPLPLSLSLSLCTFPYIIRFFEFSFLFYSSCNKSLSLFSFLFFFITIDL